MEYITAGNSNYLVGDEFFRVFLLFRAYALLLCTVEYVLKRVYSRRETPFCIVHSSCLTAAILTYCRSVVL